MAHQEKIDMARPRKIEEKEAQAVVASMVAKPVELHIEEMPLTSLAEYMRYNRRAREENKRLKLLRYPIKQCPIELHPHERVVFGRNDQPTNPLPVFLSNEMIHFDRTKPRDQLRPGQAYDLPRCIIQHLSERGTPVWQWFENPDGSKETRKASTSPRFSLRTVYAE
jgi:hypothetical protein